MYEEQYVPLDSIIFLAAEDFRINTQPWLCSLRHRISNIMTKLKTISSFHTELMFCFLCCFATRLSSSFRIISLFGTLRVVFLFTKITGPVVTSLFTGPGGNSHQLIFLFYFFFIQHRESWLLHDKLNFQHLCFFKVQSPLSSYLLILARLCCSLQG